MLPNILLNHIAKYYWERRADTPTKSCWNSYSYCWAEKKRNCQISATTHAAIRRESCNDALYSFCGHAAPFIAA